MLGGAITFGLLNWNSPSGIPATLRKKQAAPIGCIANDPEEENAGVVMMPMTAGKGVELYLLEYAACKSLLLADDNRIKKNSGRKCLLHTMGMVGERSKWTLVGCDSIRMHKNWMLTAKTAMQQ